MSTLNQTGRMSNRRTDLTTLNNLWHWVSKEVNVTRGWYPNRIAHNITAKESLINTQRKEITKHWGLNAKALADALVAEHAGRVIQTYVRLTDPDGTFVAQETSQNVWRRLQHVPTISGQHGPYWWIDSEFHPYDAADPLASQYPF